MNQNGFFQHPRDYLLLELEKRQARNSSYSLRAFARDLAIAPSTLSEVMKGRYGLSERKASQIAALLGFSPEQTQHFVDLFLQKFGQKRTQRRGASARIHQRRANQYHSLAVDAFRAVADWHHMAILEWISVAGGEIKSNSRVLKQIALELNIELSLVHEALRRLARLGQIETTAGVCRLLEDFTAVGADVPSEAIRRFHQQILSKALESLERDAVELREVSSTVFSFPKDRLTEAKKVLKDFRREFGERFGTDKTPDAVYCLAMQFFPLAREIKRSKDDE